MRVLIAGGSGLLGTALARSLLGDGHPVAVLSRRPQRPRRLPVGARTVQWDGRTLGDWVDELASSDAVVQLSGASIFGRWTAARKRSIRDSRVATSRLLAEAFAVARRRPEVLVQGSAIGYYGDRGDEVVTEATPAGGDFLARVGVDWELASAPVESLGVRRAIARTGVVLSREGGALTPLRRASALFVGGPIGDGRQWMPWIHEGDEVLALRFLLATAAASGPFNLVSPEPVRNADFCRALGRVLRRPSCLAVPQAVVALLLGELGDTLLGGQRASPARLLALGFSPRFPGLEGALTDLLAGG